MQARAPATGGFPWSCHPNHQQSRPTALPSFDPPPPPSCQNASTSCPLSSSRQIKGVCLGTPGGAEKPLTPPLMARTPLDAMTGIAPRVRPGTSRCMGRVGGWGGGGVMGVGVWGEGRVGERVWGLGVEASRPAPSSPPPPSAHQADDALPPHAQLHVHHPREVEAEGQRVGVKHLFLGGGAVVCRRCRGRMRGQLLGSANRHPAKQSGPAIHTASRAIHPPTPPRNWG